jgi:integrase
VSDLAAQLSPATVAEAHRLLSAVLRAAVRDRLLAVDPCEGIKVPRRRKRDTADQVIDRDTVRHHLLPAVPDRYRALVATAAGTGMRWGELAGLCDDALDPERRTIRVIRTVVEVSGNTSFKPYPKSAAGRRSIPIPAWLRPTLLAHLDQQPPGQHGLAATRSANRYAVHCSAAGSGDPPWSAPASSATSAKQVPTATWLAGPTTPGRSRPRNSPPNLLLLAASSSRPPAVCAFTTCATPTRHGWSTTESRSTWCRR